MCAHAGMQKCLGKDPTQVSAPEECSRRYMAGNCLQANARVSNKEHPAVSGTSPVIRVVKPNRSHIEQGTTQL
jgi:uncharacterized protein YgiB involved in biofilm formation